MRQRCVLLVRDRSSEVLLRSSSASDPAEWGLPEFPVPIGAGAQTVADRAARCMVSCGLSDPQLVPTPRVQGVQLFSVVVDGDRPFVRGGVRTLFRWYPPGSWPVDVRDSTLDFVRVAYGHLGAWV